MKLAALLRSAGARHGAVLGVAMGAAGALDYVVSVVAGRGLDPVDFGVFVAIAALVQVLTLLSHAIRMVVAFYAAELEAGDPSGARAAAFVRAAWRWAVRWGLAGTALAVLAGPLVARALRLPDAWPVWAASGMVLALFLREALFGALQGGQAFARFGLAQVGLALLRLVLVAALLGAGYGAPGAIAAQPLASALCVAAVAWSLRGVLAARGGPVPAAPAVELRYAASTVVGLAAFGLLSNADALFVRAFHGGDAAASYAPVVTLAKLALFLPWAIGLVLFPKVAKRRAEGRDPRPILLFALAASTAPGLAVSAVFFLAPGAVVRTIFTAAYGDPGAVLGLASLAATTYAGLHIWLNYALSLERKGFVAVLAGVVALQAAGMLLFGRESLLGMTLAMVSAGIAGNVAGWLATRTSPDPAPGAVAVAIEG
jgi:O-antigen/teichoic acid export membrane protein